MKQKTTFTVMDSKKGKTFATLDEASAYEREHRKRTGEFVAVVAGTKAVTHTYGVQPTVSVKPAPKVKPTTEKKKAKSKVKSKGTVIITKKARKGK